MILNDNSHLVQSQQGSSSAQAKPSPKQCAVFLYFGAAPAEADGKLPLTLRRP